LPSVELGAGEPLLVSTKEGPTMQAPPTIEEVVTDLPSESKIPVEEAGTWLVEPQPVWQLDLDGTLRAANLLALWLWDILSPDLLTSKKLPRLRVFNIFARNLERIPLEENRDFLEKKSATAKFIESTKAGEAPILAFRQAMMQTPEHRAIYERAEAWKFIQAFNYELTLVNFEDIPLLRDPQNRRYYIATAERLTFDTNILVLLNQNEQPVGFLAVYNPRGSMEEGTTVVIADKYRELIDLYNEILYVLTREGGDEERTHNMRERITEMLKSAIPKKLQPEMEEYVKERQEEVKRLSEMSTDEWIEYTKDMPYTQPKDYRTWRRGLPL
jgi:hypothetical protein